ncbi:hypothetical protein AVEN_266540-1 [Araneus ventricosus]|uniref:Uncharacterized protein n=1 Tax=Araneus ventricosus TaxID=182803 RepID=A0A4Y2RYX7_ARAVE|nr:hypothetical protein AVEN_266540-1 [Araneus ventricosus]
MLICLVRPLWSGGSLYFGIGKSWLLDPILLKICGLWGTLKHDDLVIRSQLRCRRTSAPISPKIRYVGLIYAKYVVKGQTSSCWCDVEVLIEDGCSGVMLFRCARFKLTSSLPN